MLDRMPSWLRSRFWPEATREIVLVVSAYFLYTTTKNLINPESVASAFVHAGAVVSAERALGIFVEPAIQRWFIEEFFAGLRFLTYFYIWGFWIILYASAVFFFVRQRDAYYRLRRVFLLTLVLGILVYVVYPLAPPRMLTSLGFIDSMKLFGLDLLDGQSDSIFTYNQYAAMPSLHYAWSLLIAVAWIRAGGRLAMVFGLTFQALILIAIVATANHFILDAVFGAILIAGALWIENWYTRRRAAGEPLLSLVWARCCDTQIASRVESSYTGLPGTW